MTELKITPASNIVLYGMSGVGKNGGHEGDFEAAVPALKKTLIDIVQRN